MNGGFFDSKDQFVPPICSPRLCRPFVPPVCAARLCRPFVPSIRAAHLRPRSGLAPRPPRWMASDQWPRADLSGFVVVRPPARQPFWPDSLNEGNRGAWARGGWRAGCKNAPAMHCAGTASMNRARRACQSTVRTWLHSTTPSVTSPAPASGTVQARPLAKPPPPVTGQASAMPNRLNASVDSTSAARVDVRVMLAPAAGDAGPAGSSACRLAGSCGARHSRGAPPSSPPPQSCPARAVFRPAVTVPGEQRQRHGCPRISLCSHALSSPVVHQRGMKKAPECLIHRGACVNLGLPETLPWCLRQESNLYLALRRRLFYPLNYGGTLGQNSRTAHQRHPQQAGACAAGPGAHQRHDQITSSALSAPDCARSVKRWAMR